MCSSFSNFSWIILSGSPSNCLKKSSKSFKNVEKRKEVNFLIVIHRYIFASQGLRFWSPFSPPLADLEYILKFARNATWWFIEVAPLR